MALEFILLQEHPDLELVDDLEFVVAVVVEEALVNFLEVVADFELPLVLDFALQDVVLLLYDTPSEPMLDGLAEVFHLLVELLELLAEGVFANVAEVEEVGADDDVAELEGGDGLPGEAGEAVEEEFVVLGAEVVVVGVLVAEGELDDGVAGEQLRGEEVLD